MMNRATLPRVPNRLDYVHELLRAADPNATLMDSYTADNKSYLNKPNTMER